MLKRAHEQTQENASSSAKKAKSTSSAVPNLTGRALQSAREATLLDKIAKADADGTLDASLKKWNAMPNSPLRTVDRSQAKARVMMDQCGVTQPLQTTHFRVDRDNLTLSPVGHESFNNSPSTPCTTCLSTMHAVKISTVVGWVNNIIGNYSSLSAVWFWKQWVRQGGKYTFLGDGNIEITQAALCNVSGVPMTCVNGPFMASINNISKDHSAGHLHTEENSELICVWLNVRQDNAFDGWNLKPAFLDMARESAQAQQDLITNPNRIDEAAQALSAAIRKNWSQHKKKKLNGVTASSSSEAAKYRLQILDLDVFSICSKQRSSHAQHDKEEGRVPTVPLTTEAIMNKWSNAPRCVHSHVLTTIRNGPRRLSLDRIAHGVAHEDSTTLVVCRMLNSPAGMTRAKWCSIMLLQNKVDLTGAVRASFQAEADSLALAIV